MTLASFGNFFGLDTAIIVLVIMLFFGGKRIPGVARSIGQSIREFRRGKDEEKPEPPRL